MKQLIFFLLCAIGLLSCNHKDYNQTDYKDADLLFKYINQYRANDLTTPEYILATYRTILTCKNCGSDVCLNDLLDSIKVFKDSIPTFIITDNINFSDSLKNDTIAYLKNKNPFLENIFRSDPILLERYGLHDPFPNIFHIKDKCLIKHYRVINNKYGQ